MKKILFILSGLILNQCHGTDLTQALTLLKVKLLQLATHLHSQSTQALSPFDQAIKEGRVKQHDNILRQWQCHEKYGSGLFCGYYAMYSCYVFLTSKSIEETKKGLNDRDAFEKMFPEFLTKKAINLISNFEMTDIIEKKMEAVKKNIFLISITASASPNIEAENYYEDFEKHINNFRDKKDANLAFIINIKKKFHWDCVFAQKKNGVLYLDIADSLEDPLGKDRKDMPEIENLYTILNTPVKKN